MRKITEIILHCTATLPGQLVTVDRIRQWHKARGFSDIGYHYIIQPDGTIQEGRPLSKIGAHTIGHNRYTIGIAYVGGLDSHGKPCDTRSYEQKISLNKLITFLRHSYPSIIRVSGHNNYSKKDCPCFNAIKEYNIINLN